ncbi:DUF3293 domain-containing protein [Novacetimonas hansenii]|uniref:DUF3293 domain-containing protein n=1 Tax=Novacetimonas hansenii TaxID=436 RepID=UPI00095014DC|nr:DUF3293 domain-containing protein [Novacetimonas hansenii]
MSGILPPSAATCRSYRLSTYHAASLPVVRVGQRPDDAGLPRRGTVVMLSACNPGGRRRTDGWNTRMMARLAHDLRHVPHYPGEGRLGRWSEPLYVVKMGLAPALRLARRYRQNAVVVVRRGQAARLVYLA